MSAYLSDIGLNKLAQYVTDNLLLREEDIMQLLGEMHPVGSYYWSNSNSKSPAQLFGGTWEPVYDRLLYCTTSNSQGGSSSVTISSSHLPSHSHGSISHSHSSTSHSHPIPSHGHSGGSHSHSVSHTHPGYGAGMGYNPNNSRERFFGNSGGNYFTTSHGANRTYTSTYNGSSGSIPSWSGTSSSATFSYKLASGGSGTSSNPDSVSLSSESYNTTYSIDTLPSSTKAYCWYRSA